MPKEMLEYIDIHYPEYDTITTLKTDAMNDNYNKKVEQEIKKLNEMFLEKENLEAEI
ncbi:MAG: hypothetical protein HFJ58_03680 [Clostridia bacterium]|nr:hypothetical protein [Clostridia bacterium]